MQYTENYQFREPTPATDVVKVGDINYNSRKIDEILHDTQISLADAYDSTRTSANPYNTGDVVMYELLMYKCKEDGVYGNWDASKWERTVASSSGASGSDVEANPSGTATDTLNKIGIDGTIYGIEGGGGAGGVYLDNHLISSSVTVTSGSSISLDDSISNYDIIVLDVSSSTYTDWREHVFLDRKNIALNTDYTRMILRTSTETIGIRFKFTDNSTLYAWGDGSRSMIIHDVIGIKVGGDLVQPLIYSTEEREVGVWLDNKPLYQKSYSLNTTIRITQSGANITSYIDNESVIDQIVGARGNNTSTADNQGTDLWVGRSSSNLMAYSSEGSDVDVITLWYTKTTDTAGSGIWTPSGVPAVHYSTDEQVIGTWTDGSTLYQKVFTGNLTMPSNDWYDFTLDSGMNIIRVEDAKYTQSSGGTVDMNWYRSSSIYSCYTISANVISALQIGIANITGYRFIVQYTKSSS